MDDHEDGMPIRRLRSTNQYSNNIVCAEPLCLNDVQPGFLYCATCGMARRKAYHGAMNEVDIGFPGPNMIAHCGRFHPVTSLPATLPCGHTVLTVVEERPHG